MQAGETREFVEDAEDEVPDWTTFGLGVLGDEDSVEVRDALYRRLSDSYMDVREEALHVGGFSYVNSTGPTRASALP